LTELSKLVFKKVMKLLTAKSALQFAMHPLAETLSKRCIRWMLSEKTLCLILDVVGRDR
jgi:hypothetical protein